jgi:hypothetical protein
VVCGGLVAEGVYQDYGIAALAEVGDGGEGAGV